MIRKKLAMLTHPNFMHIPGWRIMLIACTLLFLQTYPALAQEITAGLQKKGSAGFVLEVDLPKPAPGNIIAEIQYPPSLDVQTAQPRAAKIDRKKGLIKWLIKNARPGKLKLQAGFSQPFEKSTISGYVRYRTIQEGTLAEIEAAWK
jgi:hypothetical protein